MRRLLLSFGLLLTAALGAQPVDPTTAEHVRRGVAAREAGQLADAQRELESAVAGAPNFAEAHLFLGLVLHERDDFSGASESLSRALAIKADLQGARGLLGYDLLRLGRIGDAIGQLELALSEDSQNAQTSRWLGQAYLRAGQPGDAIEHLERARVASTNDPHLLYLLGKAYLELSLSSQAELLALAPDSAYAHLAAAEDHDLNGRRVEALAEYRKAIKKDPSLPGVWSAIGDIERDRGDNEVAAAAYRQALEVDSENPALRLGYGQALVQLGRSEEALPHLMGAADSTPRPAGALAALGKAQLDLDRLTDAEVTLHKALALAADQQERMRIHYQLALVYRKQGAAESANEHLREFEELRKKLTVDER